MTSQRPTPLLVGEIFVDVTITHRGQENKLRFGGVAHAARGFWALGQPFAAAVFLPNYLEKSARDYLTAFGCVKFTVLGYVTGAPNVTLIFDPTEVDDQGYETLLRDEKTIGELTATSEDFLNIEDVLIFPGTYDLASVYKLIPPTSRLHIDVAYDIPDVSLLHELADGVSTIFISTSSHLFNQLGETFESITAAFAKLNPSALVLKENRGGARLYTYSPVQSQEIPAQLATTVNSVGVGDVFDAAYLTCLSDGPLGAVWRASMAASAYAQTTEPDLFKTYVQRDLRLTVSELQELGGTSLPWDSRRTYQIYLAAPDFKNADRAAIERAISALTYHNFSVRRPVVENGELPKDSDLITLAETYRKDVDLLRECHLVFAVPTARDPGTLVEVGLAIASKIPVVVYDPNAECMNTMVIAGSSCYSHNLDTCLNATFSCLSSLRHA